LNKQPLQDIILTQDQLKAGGVIVKGLILCNKCRKKFSGVCQCTEKGNAKCLIQIYWKGKHYEYRRDKQGFIFTYDTAVDRLTEIGTAIKKGIFNPADFSDMKVKERKFENKIQVWLEQKGKECKDGDISPSSLGNIQGYIKNYYLPFFSEWDVREIQYEQLEEFKDSLPDTLKKKTKSNILVSFHSFFTWLRKKGVRGEVPLFPVVDCIDNSSERVALDYEQQAFYLKMIPEQYRDVLEFGMETGLRPGELVALKWKDIDIRNHRALIRRTISAYVHILERTKGKSKKFIPLSDRAIEILQKGATELPEAFVFINPDTKRRYSTKMPNVLWKRYTRLDTVTYYEASRHSFCTQLVDDGLNTLQAKELMRHTDVRTTQKYYHGDTNRLRDAVNQRGRVIHLVNRSKIEAGNE
jgi:integrase